MKNWFKKHLYRKLIIGLVAIAIVVVLVGLLTYKPTKIKASSDYLSIDIGTNISYQIGSQLAPDCVVKFEPSGTHIKNDQLKIRLDVYLGESYESYKDYYVSVVDEKSIEFQLGYKGELDKDGNPVDSEDYQKWIDGLPHIMQLNPVLSVFVSINKDITVTELQDYIKWMNPWGSSN